MLPFGRMSGQKKEFLPLPSSLGQLTVLGSAVTAFASCTEIGSIVIAIKEGEEDIARSCLPRELQGSQGKIIFTIGGPSRRSTVHKALLCLKEIEPTHVLVHDGARPWVSLNLIKQIIKASILNGAVIPVLPLVETPKELKTPGLRNDIGFIERHLRRESLYTAQTPQGFAYPDFLKAQEKAAEKEASDSIEYTDDA